MPTRPYTKPWLSHEDQLAKLKSRGIIVDSDEEALHFLSHVNYYRFIGYSLAFEDSARDEFQSGVTFEDIKSAYQFDFVLRDLLSEALEIIEVDLRTSVAYNFGKTYGPFGHTDSRHFFSAPHRKKTRLSRDLEFTHSDWLDRVREETERSSEKFTKHFENTYSCYPDLPIWTATEVMSFGSLSRMVGGMKSQDQKTVYERYQPDSASFFTSWMHHLTVARNACAHHCRMWDRLWSIQPSQPSGKYWRPPYLLNNQRISITFQILFWMMAKCPGYTTYALPWMEKIREHLSHPPKTTKAHLLMGISEKWFENPLFSVATTSPT